MWILKLEMSFQNLHGNCSLHVALLSTHSNKTDGGFFILDSYLDAKKLDFIFVILDA